MNWLKKLLGAVAILAAAALPAYANVQVMCAPEPSVGVAGPRTFGAANPGQTSPVPSGTLYTLNGLGCAPIQGVDIPYAQSQGFIPGPNTGQPIVFNTGVLNGNNAMLGGITQTASGCQATTCTLQAASGSPQIGILPAWSKIKDIIISNAAPLSASQGGTGVVTGGLDFGWNANGTGGGSASQANIASNVICNTNCLISVRDIGTLGGFAGQTLFSTTTFSQATPIFVSAVTNWGSSNVTITVLWEYF